jgi:hypothetical protein
MQAEKKEKVGYTPLSQGSTFTKMDKNHGPLTQAT